MELEEMKLGDVLKLVSVFKGKTQKETQKESKEESKEEYGGIRIVVLQRGWVAIGKFYQKGSKCRLENGATIRIWGTSGKAGLSYLAENGPIADKTILDKTKMPIRFHELTAVHMYDCVESVWEKHL